MALIPAVERSVVFSPSRPANRARLRVERLEVRATPAAGLGGGVVELAGDFHPVIVAGDPNGSPTDSPSNRVDVNTDKSQYDGVGSVRVQTKNAVYIGSGTPISSRHVLTAGHVVDINSDGRVTSKDRITSVSFILNYGGNQTSTIAVSRITMHPDYTGFAKPSVNDDICVLELSSDIPAGVPIYDLPTSDLTAGTTLTMVGYGRSGTGVSGYTTNASFTVKRSGQNNADAFYTQDDSGRPAANEVFRFDFDGPTGNGTFGGGTLGNDIETQLGGGDSGGPSFVGTTVVGVNTFTQGSNTPLFGSLGGGINVFPYLSFITGAMSGTSVGGSGSVSIGPVTGGPTAVPTLFGVNLAAGASFGVPSPFGRAQSETDAPDVEPGRDGPPRLAPGMVV
jgi:hypothetical protein